MISYLLAQLIDIRIYHFWKNLTKGKHLWLRNNFSTFTSQFIDSFSVIFFLTIFQILDWSQFVGLVFSAFIFKILVAAFDTPFLYILVGIFRKKFDLPFLSDFIKEGTDIKISVSDYFTNMLDQNMSWKDAENIKKKWGGIFCLKGIMSKEDAKKAVDIGADAIMISNHGGRQLDGSRSPFDQLDEIIDAVGGKIEIILDGGIRRGTHVLKALSLGATACSFGKGFLFALGAGGQKGVEQILKRMKEEIRRDMILLGCKSIKELNKTKIVYR